MLLGLLLLLLLGCTRSIRPITSAATIERLRELVLVDFTAELRRWLRNISRVESRNMLTLCWPCCFCFLLHAPGA